MVSKLLNTQTGKNCTETGDQAKLDNFIYPRGKEFDVTGVRTQDLMTAGDIFLFLALALIPRSSGPEPKQLPLLTEVPPYLLVLVGFCQTRFPWVSPTPSLKVELGRMCLCMDCKLYLVQYSSLS